MFNKTLLLTITIFILVFSTHKSLPYTYENFVIIRSEGACQNNNTNSCRDRAIHNAILKSVKSHIGDIATLSKSESDKLISVIGSNVESFIRSIILSVKMSMMI